MHDRRRRAVSLVVFAVAALATAGTSPPMPSPAPTQRLDTNGTLHLTAASPVAVQPIEIQVAAGDLELLDFVATLAQLPSDGSVLMSIGSTDGAAPRAPSAPTPQPATSSVVAQTSFPFTCVRPPCGGSYLLVVTWTGAPAGGVADVAWSLNTTARFKPSYSSSTPSPGRIVVTAGDATAPAAVELGAASSGGAVHLTERDRFRAWTVSFHRDTSPLGQDSTRPVTQALLSVAVSQTKGIAFGAGSQKDRREENRRDPPIQVRLLAPGDLSVFRWASDAPVGFDPFVLCGQPGPCDTEAVIELAWADGRPDTAFEATWTIDLAAAGLTGTVEPIRTTIDEVPVPELAVSKTSGSFDAGGATTRGQSTFVARGPNALDVSSPWSRLGLPARAIVTARVTSIGSTSLPADAVIRLYGQGSMYAGGSALGTSVEVRPGEEATFAFEPTLLCTFGQANGCELRGSIGSSIGSPSPNAAPEGIAVRVDWSMELGAAVTRDGQFAITVDPSTGPSQSSRP
jgi:hypothetical protein